MPKSVVDRLGREIPKWDQRHWAVFQKIAQRTRRGVPITHDLSNDDEFNFVMQQHGGREFVAKHYPATLSMLERARVTADAAKKNGIDPRMQNLTLLQFDLPPTNEWQSANAIIQSSLVQSGSKTCVADGLSTIIDGTFITQMTLTLTDMSAGEMIAQETVPQLYDRGMYTTVGAQGDLVNVGNLGMATLTASYIPSGQQHMVSQTVTADIAQVCPVSPPTVAGPVHSKTVAPNPIKVALNRTKTQQPDCDYYYTTDANGRTPNVAMEVKGSATFQNTVCPLEWGKTLQGQLMLARRVDPAGASLVLTPDQFTNGITASGTQLGWSWGANNQFGKAPWDQGQVIDLILNMLVPVSGNCRGSRLRTLRSLSRARKVRSRAIARRR